VVTSHRIVSNSAVLATVLGVRIPLQHNGIEMFSD
jgi:hypothetical protein